MSRGLGDVYKRQDEEWLKISLKDKKNQEIVKMIRVEDVDEIEVKVDQSL